VCRKNGRTHELPAKKLALVFALSARRKQKRPHAFLPSNNYQIYPMYQGGRMTNKETGGPAFPFPAYTYQNGEINHGEGGMTMRDYFAAKALQALLADPEPFDLCDGDETIADTYAREAYVYADAMLKARGA